MWIGGTMTVPGVSGGSMAMILGIYDRLLTAVSGVFSDPKKHLKTLLWFGAGAGAGMLLFSRVMTRLLDSGWSDVVRYFFLGAVAGGIPLIIRSTEGRWKKRGGVLYLFAGIAAALLLAGLPDGLFAPDGQKGLSAWLFQAAGGVILAAALVLPGISASQMLYMLGIYESTIAAVGALDFLGLLPLLSGLAVGTFLTARTLERLLEDWKGQSFLTILGFMLASLADLYPGIPKDGELLPSLIAALAGFGLLYRIGSAEKGE